MSPISDERLEQMQAHLDEGGKLNCDQELLNEIQRLKVLLNTPEIHDFTKAVPLEAAHQRERWGTGHDEKKDHPDWFWVVGYLAGKALAAWKNNDRDKLKHHIITTAAVCANWHAAVLDEENAIGIGNKHRGAT